MKIYLESGEDSSEDFPPPMVIAVPNLGPENIASILEVLLETPEKRYDLNGVDTHLDCRPILVALNNGTRISESTFWRIAFETKSAGASEVSRCLNIHIKLAGEDSLGFYTYIDVVAQDPIYAFLDLHLQDTYDEELEKVLHCLVEFVEHCDLDHEQHQHEYILKALSRLSHRNEVLFARLLVFRRNHGQRSNLNFAELSQFLYRQNILRCLVEETLKSDLDTLSKSEDISMYCAIAYGTQEQLTGDVLNYCNQHQELVPETEFHPSSQKSIEYHRRLADLQWSYDGRSNVTTGFHRYRQKDGGWNSTLT